MYMNAMSRHRDARRSDTMGEYIFLTINPPEHTPLTMLCQSLNQFTHLAVVKWAVYDIEQRGTDEGDYRGIHAHMLFQRDKRPSEVLKEMDRIFLSIVPDRSKMKYITKNTIDEVKNILEYIQGNKKSPDKMIKVNNDVRMRKAYGLEQLYIVGDCPLLVKGNR